MSKKTNTLTKAKKDPVQHFADQIISEWRKSADSILAMSIACAEADEALVLPLQKKQLLEMLPFSPPVLSKLVKIGNDRRLHQKPIAALLPPNYSIIYPLTGLKDESLELARTEDVIKPQMTRASLSKWMNEKGLTGKQAADHKPVCPTEFLAALLPPADLTDEARDAFDLALQELCKTFNVTPIRPPDPLGRETVLMGKWYANIEEKLRALARKRIKKEVDRQIKKSKSPRETNKECMKRIGLVEDDWHIDDWADHDDVRRALDALGIADEFNELYKDAERKAAKPKGLDNIPEISVERKPFPDELSGPPGASAPKQPDSETIEQVKFDKNATKDDTKKTPVDDSEIEKLLGD